MSSRFILPDTPVIGDPAPWFDAETLAGAHINLSTLGGRWLALFFIPDLNDASAVRLLAELLGEENLFTLDHLVFFGLLNELPAIAEQLAAASHPALGFIADTNQSIGKLYQNEASPYLIILDPQLRLYKRFSLSESSPDIIRNALRTLPAVSDYADVVVVPPVLVIPRVFEPELCEYLIGLYEENGGHESGFMLDRDGKTETVINHALKSRRDYIINDQDVRELIRARIVRRVVPAIERFFQFRPTRMDRAIVSCYAAEDGGHFFRHRDNINAGARHRRFAASFNLNRDYDGCEVVFPEFGNTRYKAPEGGAVIFSTGILHEVMPVTRGKRYAFIPFFYGEEDARLRLANNALLQTGERKYTGDNDRLFPD